MKQRSEQERVAELEAKIAAIRAREERKRAKANPAVRHALAALKEINKALAETADPEARRPIEDSRAGLAAFVATHGLTLPPTEAVAVAAQPGAKRGRPKKVEPAA